jgi:hypothetical protein
MRGVKVGRKKGTDKKMGMNIFENAKTKSAGMTPEEEN